MLKGSVRFGLAVCVSGLSVLLSVGMAWAQTTSDESLALLPLRPVQIEAGDQAMPLDLVAQDINEQMADARSRPKEPEGLTFADIPLIGDIVDSVVDEEGNFDGGVDLPVDIGVGSVMDAYGMTVGIDWSM